MYFIGSYSWLGLGGLTKIRRSDDQQQDNPLRRVRQGQVGRIEAVEPAEFRRAAAFVLSAAASYITGAMIPVDGGAIGSI
jgi:NAD(P)-dependent dehydrogenase (short-subunit alcohol dehydrogenase family)